MTFSIKKFNALFIMKASALSKNANVLTTPLMALGFVFAMRLAVPDTEPHDDGMLFNSFLLNMGIIFNVIMGGLMMSSQPLAEEKEKNTLRVLMTSSVSSLEFFIASLLPPLILMMCVNLLLVPLSENNFTNIPLFSYLLMTTICSCISLMLGFVIGLLAKNQMQTTLLLMPFMLILAFLPMFSVFNTGAEKLAGFLYVGVLNDFVNLVTAGSPYQWSFKTIAVLVAWIIIATLTFMFVYRRNSLDK